MYPSWEEQLSLLSSRIWLKLRKKVLLLVLKVFQDSDTNSVKDKAYIRYYPQFPLYSLVDSQPSNKVHKHCLQHVASSMANFVGRKQFVDLGHKIKIIY